MHGTNEVTTDYQGYDPVTETYHFNHDWGTNQSVLETIVFAVAAVTGKPPAEVEPLYNVIDPDALSVLFSPISDENPRSDGAVSFTFEDQAVTVHASGEIIIDVPDDAELEATPRWPLTVAFGAIFDVQRVAIELGCETIKRALSLQRNRLERY